MRSTEQKAAWAAYMREYCRRPGVWKKSPERIAYFNAKKRTQNPRDSSYVNYGGRGILFLFESFSQFMDELGSKPSPEYTLDRIDNDGNYEPGNVRWATRHEQNLNQRGA